MESGTLKTSEYKQPWYLGKSSVWCLRKAILETVGRGSWTLTAGLKIRPRTYTTSEAALRRNSILHDTNGHRSKHQFA